MKSVKSDFISSGVRCDGDLYLPEGADKPPVVKPISHHCGNDIL